MKVLVTVQEPGKPRQRCIIDAQSTFEAAAHVLSAGLDLRTYISAKPASPEDIIQYGDLL